MKGRRKERWLAENRKLTPGVLYRYTRALNRNMADKLVISLDPVSSVRTGSAQTLPFIYQSAEYSVSHKEGA